MADELNMENVDNEDNLDPEFPFGSVTLTLEDDTELECMILSIFPAGDKDYIALLPVGADGEADDNADILIYRFIDHWDDQEPEILNIEDDDEYDIAADAFDELLDDEEFEEGDEDGEDEEEDEDDEDDKDED